jgi:type III secretion system (T3SS) SseB-like protein
LPVVEFEPANELETRMLAALDAEDQDGYLRLLADAELLLPRPGTEAPTWATVAADGVTFVAAYTSPAAMAISTAGQFARYRSIALPDLVAAWPDQSWSLAIDPGLPLAAHLPASLLRQIVAGEFGAPSVPAEPVAAVAEPVRSPVPGPRPAPPTPAYDDATQILPRIGDEDDEPVPTVMQKLIPPDQVGFYLDKGYDWVAGYVHRWQDAEGLTTAPDLLAALGLGAAARRDGGDAYLLRWTAYRAELYRSADGETAAVPEYWVNSIRLPHQAEIWRVTGAGEHHFVAVYDADEQRWLVNRALVGDR